MALTATQTSDSVNRLPEIFFNGFAQMKTLDAGLGIQVVNATRDKFAMKSISGSNFSQAYAAAPAEQGTIALSDEEFTISKFSINTPLDYDVLKDTEWKDAIANINNQDFPMELKEAIIAYIMDLEKEGIEAAMWTSWFTEIDADLTAATLTAQIVAAATPTTVPANIQGIFNDMIDAAPVTLLERADRVKLFVNPATAWAYKRSLQTQNMAVIPSVATNFGGFDLVEIPNLPVKRILLGLPENLAVGIPAPNSDIMQLDVIDQKSNLKNQANVFGNYGYGVGQATTDFVTFEDTTA